jgi:hypothetical protein
MTNRKLSRKVARDARLELLCERDDLLSRDQLDYDEERRAAELQLEVLGWSPAEEKWFEGALREPDRDDTPVVPWQWAFHRKWNGHGPVELVSYPWVATASDAAGRGEWIVLIRTKPGNPGSLKEVPLADLHEIGDRTLFFEYRDRERFYYGDGSTDFIWADELPRDHPNYEPRKGEV